MQNQSKGLKREPVPWAALGLMILILCGGCGMILKSFKISPVNQTIQVGQTLQYTATGTPVSGPPVDETGSTAWSSSDTAVASIENPPAPGGPPDVPGRAHGLSPGTTVIKATFQMDTDTTNLTVVAASGSACVDPRANAATQTMPTVTLKVGQMQQLTICDQAGMCFTNMACGWMVNNSSGMITTDGLFSCSTPGTGMITGMVCTASTGGMCFSDTASFT